MEAWWIRCGDGSVVYDGGQAQAPGIVYYGPPTAFLA